MEQRSISHSSSPDSWLRVALNTVTLAMRRRRIERADDQLLGPRGWVVLAVGIAALVVGGGALYVMGPFGLDGSTSSTANGEEPGNPWSDPNDTTGGFAADPSAPVSADPTGSRSRSRITPTASQSKAAAGLEIAERIDIEVSSTASRMLRSGAVDGRVLIVLAALSTERRVTAITATPSQDANAPAELELGVIQVDAVLEWLDKQPDLRPDRFEARRSGDLTYLRLEYDSPEPRGLFTS